MLILKSRNPRQTNDGKDLEKKLVTPFLAESTMKSESHTGKKVRKEDTLDQSMEIQKPGMDWKWKKNLTPIGSLKTIDIT